MSSLTLVCTATSIEAKACKRGIAAARADDRFEVLQTGMGLSRARQALEKRFADRSLARPSRVISSGFAGSLHRELIIGSWISAPSVALYDGSVSNPIEFDEPTCGFQTRSVQLLSLKQALAQDSAKLGLSLSGKLPTAIDMESYAWAEVCQLAGIPFSVLRLISDNPDAPLPAAIASFASLATADSHSERARHLGAGLCQVFTEPSHLARFIARSSRLPKLLEAGWKEISKQ